MSNNIIARMSAAPARLPTTLPTTCGVSRGAGSELAPASAADDVVAAGGTPTMPGALFPPPPPPGYIVDAASEGVVEIADDMSLDDADEGTWVETIDVRGVDDPDIEMLSKERGASV